MVDLHCHILHEIDDGSGSLNESVALCRQAVNNNIDTVVLTPHLEKVMDAEQFFITRDERVAELRAEIAKQNISLKLVPAAEVYVNDDIFYAPDISRAAIEGTSFILIEFDFNGLTLKRIARYLNEFLDRGLSPIVAHPERYSYFQQDYNLVNYLSDKGVLFQVNASSLIRLGKREEFELGYKMVKYNIASFIASDAHSMATRSNNLEEMLKYFPKDISHHSLKYMLEVAPQSVLHNEEPPYIHRMTLADSWKR